MDEQLTTQVQETFGVTPEVAQNTVSATANRRSPATLQTPPTPTLEASALTQPQPKISLPQPVQPPTPQSFVDGLGVDETRKGVQDFVQVNTQESQQRGSVLDELLGQDRFSSQDVFQSTFDKQLEQLSGGVDSGTYLKQLADANTKLATLQGNFRSRAQAISGAEGQSQVFESAGLTENERQRAISVGNQALVVQAMQGNVDTSRQIALDTANFATQDRKVELDTLLAQYGALDDIVDGQEAQLLEQAKQEAQLERDEIDNSQATVNAAIESGGASVQEMTQMNNLLASGDYAGAQALGAQVVSRVSGEDRNLDRALKGQQLANAELENLIKRAGVGDVDALAELNITPTDKVSVSNEEAAKIQKEIAANDTFKALNDVGSSIEALTEYQKVFEEVGTTSGVTSPFDNERLKNAYAAATLNLKEFFNLGVLNGPDLEIIEDVLGNPTSQGFVTNISAKTGAEAGLKNMYTQIEDKIDSDYLTIKSQYGQYDPNQIGLIEDVDRKYLLNKAKINPGVALFLEENPDLPIEDAIQVINTKF